MDNIKNDNYFLNKIIKDINFILANIKNISIDELADNEILIDSIMFRLIQIAENSNKLSDAYKATHQDIEWNAIKGLRNKIVHNYGVINLKIIYETIISDLPILFKQLSDE